LEIISSWLIRKIKLAADLSARETRFDPKFVHVRLSVHEMAVRQVILAGFRLSPVGISPQLLGTPKYISLPSTGNQLTVPLSNISLHHYFVMHIIIIIIIIITIELSLGGTSPYTSTDKKNKNKYT